jgi:hypothetical protein
VLASTRGFGKKSYNNVWLWRYWRAFSVVEKYAGSLSPFRENAGFSPLVDVE